MQLTERILRHPRRLASSIWFSGAVVALRLIFDRRPTELVDAGAEARLELVARDVELLGDHVEVERNAGLRQSIGYGPVLRQRRSAEERQGNQEAGDRSGCCGRTRRRRAASNKRAMPSHTSCLRQVLCGSARKALSQAGQLRRCVSSTRRCAGVKPARIGPIEEIWGGQIDRRRNYRRRRRHGEGERRGILVVQDRADLAAVFSHSGRHLPQAIVNARSGLAARGHAQPGWCQPNRQRLEQYRRDGRSARPGGAPSSFASRRLRLMASASPVRHCRRPDAVAMPGRAHKAGDADPEHREDQQQERQAEGVEMWMSNGV